MKIITKPEHATNDLKRTVQFNDTPQKKRQSPSGPGSPGGEGSGPSRPEGSKPNTEDLLKRMRKVDPDQAKRYRQRTGQ